MKTFTLALVLALAACGGPLDEAPVIDDATWAASELSTGPCPGKWGPAPNYSGLSGTFSRTSGFPAATGDLLRVTFKATSTSPGAEVGTASRSTQGSFVVKTGGYSAMPDNPAIGATLSFGGAGYPQDGSLGTQLYFVAGMNRNALGKVSSLCLGGTNFGTWFILTRIW